MVVESPLALFTTLFGWQFYNVIWSTLLATGIALLPFLGVLIEALFTNREDGEFVGSDPVGVYKKIEAKILLMLIVVAFAGQPSSLTSITPDTISFTAEPTLLDPAPAQTTAANPGNSFADTNFAAFDQLDQAGVDVPIWWYSVLQVSAGINAAVIAGLPEIESLRDITRLAQAANISDPVVRSETSAFFTMCYLPAKARFERENPEGAESVDISLIGSRFFLEDFRIRGGEGPIVYDVLRATRPIQGFPFNAARDIEWLPEFQPEFGKPTCREWWLGEGTNGRPGLRQLLLDQIDLTQDGLLENIVASVTARIPNGFGQDETEDRLIQSVLTRDPPTITNTSFGESGLEPTDGYLQAKLREFVPIVTNVGVAGAAGIFALAMDVITQVLPLMQPMILMGIFAVLPFAMIASRYSISFLAIGAFGIFTINFWPVLWHIATWVDDNLVVALFPTRVGADGSIPFFDVLLLKRGLLGALGETKLTLLNMVTASLFLILPGLFTVVMAWAGYRAATSIGRITDSAYNNQSVNKAASGPSQVASSATSGAKGIATRSLSNERNK